MVMSVVDDAAVYLVKGILVATLCSAYFGCLEVCGICPALVPRGFPKQFVCLGEFALILERHGKIIDRFAVVGVGVTLLRQFYSFAQVFFSKGKATLSDVPQSHGVEAADVVGVTSQCLFVVVGGVPCGMAVLFQVQTGEIELLVRFGLFG